MEKGKAVICDYCSKEIPDDKYTAHKLVCAQICECGICQQSLPMLELQQHFNKEHKYARCKQCGEKVYSIDLEDHIRDSCECTMVPCRYCSVKVHRRTQLNHEIYCTLSSKRCECEEVIAMEYWQRHIDTNHMFIGRDHDPAPIINKKLQFGQKTAITVTFNGIKDLKISEQPKRDISKEANVTAGPSGTNISLNKSDLGDTSRGHSSSANGAIPRLKKPASQLPADNGNDEVSTGYQARKYFPPPPPSSSKPILHQEENKSKDNRVKKSGNVRKHVRLNVGELSKLKPMTNQEFNARFKNIVTERPDRYSEIKTSLTELRKELSEVTAPFNSNTSTDTNNNCRGQEALCDICGSVLLLEDLLLHQAGCTVDEIRCLSPPRSSQNQIQSVPDKPPRIPCKFCNKLLPVHLVNKHQDRCKKKSVIIMY